MIVKIAQEWKLVQLNHIAIYGTKIKANASQNNLINQEEIETIRRILKNGIETDEEEDKIHGDKRGDEVPKELISHKKSPWNNWKRMKGKYKHCKRKQTPKIII